MTVGGTGLLRAGEVGFDIFFDGFNNSAFAAVSNAGGAGSDFYSINLATGAATLVGSIGGGVAIRDIALIPAPSTGLFAIAGLVIAGRRRR